MSVTKYESLSAKNLEIAAGNGKSVFVSSRENIPLKNCTHRNFAAISRRIISAKEVITSLYIMGRAILLISFIATAFG